MTDELRLRARMIAAGVAERDARLGRLAWIACPWDRPHRGGLTALVIGAAVSPVSRAPTGAAAPG